MQPQNLRKTLLQTSQGMTEQQQRQHSQTTDTQKKVKKRMTSIKHPVSQYKNTLNKIFCNFYPIKQNSTLDTKCQYQLGFLYIGGLGIVDEQILKKYDIRAVLTVMDFKKYDKQNLGEKIEDIYQIQQHQYIDVTDDHPDIGPYLNHSYDFISENLSNGLNLLVHSNEGLCRAPAIVVNYLMKKYQMKFDDAYNVVKERKAEVLINENLVDQLKNLKY